MARRYVPIPGAVDSDAPLVFVLDEGAGLPTPELIATARRAAGRDWTVGPEGAIEITTNPDLAALVAAGLVQMHYTRANAMTDDYWRLTLAGKQWLADNDNTKEATP